MRVLILMAAVLQIQTIASAAPRQIAIGNPTNSRYDLFFMPETAQQFWTPPLRLRPLERAWLNLEAPGKYWTVLRSWSSDNQFVDNVIGWFDFHRASLDYPDGELQFEPYTRQETRTETYSIERQVKEQRTRDDGTTYTITRPVREERTRQYTVNVPAIRATIVLPGDVYREHNRIDAQVYILSGP